MRPRDSQQSRLYAAGDAAHQEVSPETRRTQTIPNAELQSWVDAVLHRAPVFDRWPDRRITVCLGRGGGSTNPLGTQIVLGVKCRNPWVILHEVAHCLTSNRYADHGPEFAGVYLFLVKTVLGTDAHRALLAQMKLKRVRHCTAGLPKPNPSRRRSREISKRVAAKTQPTPAQLRDAAEVIRRAAKTGVFGEPGRKPRIHALATARELDSASRAARPHPVIALRPSAQQAAAHSLSAATIEG